MKLYASCLPDNVGGVMSLLSTCAAEIAQWCASHRLQMNSDKKTDLILFGWHVNLARLATHDCSLQIGSDTIVPATVVLVLGVQLDAELSMKAYITKTTASCLYHLRRLRQIRRRAGEDVTARLVQAFITSRLDYCNSLLAGLPSRSSLDPLQRVQNAAARLIFQLGPQDHVTPSLIQLHWLPVQYRVQFKLCSFMHSVHNGRAPAYLTDIVQATFTRSTRSCRPTVCCYYKLHSASPAHQVRRASFLARRPSRLECSTSRFPQHTCIHYLQETAQDSLF
jgi:hypothetical protein